MAGQSLPRRSVEALRRLNAELTEGTLAEELSALLTSSEIDATKIRVRPCSSTGCIPTRPRTGPPSPGPPSTAFDSPAPPCRLK